MARILCPSNLFAPFLMYRSEVSKKVSVPSCAKCADMENKKKCSHSKRYKFLHHGRKNVIVSLLQ